MLADMLTYVQSITTVFARVTDELTISTDCSNDANKWVEYCNSQPWSKNCLANPDLVCPNYNSSIDAFKNSISSATTNIQQSATSWCPSTYVVTCLEAGKAAGIEADVCTVNQVITGGALTVELDDMPQCMPSSCTTNDLVTIMDAGVEPHDGITSTFTASCGVFGLSYETVGILVIIAIAICTACCIYRQCCKAQPSQLHAPIYGQQQQQYGTGIQGSY